MTNENVPGSDPAGKSTHPEIIPIYVSDPRVGVIAYYAVLACPHRDQVAKRRGFEQAGVATWMKEFGAELGRKSVPASWTRFKNEKIEGAFRLGFKRIAKRLSAGLVGWNIVLSGSYEADTPNGKVGLIIPGAPTIPKAIQAYVTSMGTQTAIALHEAVKNATHRVWAESLPVLHLAMNNPITLQNSDRIAERRETSCFQTDRRRLDRLNLQPDWLLKSLRKCRAPERNLEQLLLGTDPHDPLGRGFKAGSAIRMVALTSR